MCQATGRQATLQQYCVTIQIIFAVMIVISIIISVIGVILCSILLNDTNIGKGLRTSMILALVGFCCIPVSFLIVAVGIRYLQQIITIPHYVEKAVYIFFVSVAVILQLASLSVKKERPHRTKLLQPIDILMNIGLVLEFLILIVGFGLIYIENLLVSETEDE